MKWSSKRTLVTGAGGFIGSHLVERLVRNGASVRALVKYSGRGNVGWLDDLEPETLRSIEIVSGDLRDADVVLRAVQSCEVVFHLGAMISIPYSYLNPTETAAVNFMGTLNILNACRTVGVSKLIHTSTSETYGTARYVPIDEQHPLQAQSPYSAAKIGADKLAESFFRSFDLPVATVRPFNTYGPRQSARGVIPTIVVQLLSGSMVKLGSLAPTRDFTFVEDTTQGMLRAAEVSASIGRVINLGSGSEISVGDLARLIIRLSGKTGEVEQQLDRIRPEKSEVERLLADNTLAREILGWKPTVTLEDGLLRTIQWVGQRMGNYRRAQSGYVI
jgi:NAD dependent epimerase/dehydratase